MRLMRKEERRGVGIVGKIMLFSLLGLYNEEGVDVGDGGLWEMIIKCSEWGVWRGLVFVDWMVRWCVFVEWVCEG